MIDPMDSRPNPQIELGLAVRRMREQAGLSQEELAMRAEVEPSLIAGIEAGQADPTWGDARRIAAALGTTVDRLAELVEVLEEEG
jgi:transcriptional regulator with XRE-family HTH domain